MSDTPSSSVPEPADNETDDTRGDTAADETSATTESKNEPAGVTGDAETSATDESADKKEDAADSERRELAVRGKHQLPARIKGKKNLPAKKTPRPIDSTVEDADIIEESQVLPALNTSDAEDNWVIDPKTKRLVTIGGSLVILLLVALAICVTLLVTQKDSSNTTTTAAPKQQVAKFSDPLTPKTAAAALATVKARVIWLGAPQNGGVLRINTTSPKATQQGAVQWNYLSPTAAKTFTAKQPTFSVLVSSRPVGSAVIDQTIKTAPADTLKVNAQNGLKALVPGPKYPQQTYIAYSRPLGLLAVVQLHDAVSPAQLRKPAAPSALVPKLAG